MNDTKRLDDVMLAVGFLSARQEAQMYWIAQLYLLLSMGQPGRMAAQIRHKLKDMQNLPPMGPEPLTPAQLDEKMIEELPMMLQVGDEIAQHLEGLQRAADERRAQQVADAR